MLGDSSPANGRTDGGRREKPQGVMGAAWEPPAAGQPRQYAALLRAQGSGLGWGFAGICAQPAR